jgi:anti-sigma regulatory factor (Ser/Thr protein kinase)
VEFFLTGQPGERQKFVSAFEDFCRRNGVPDAARQATDLALEEHLTNVLNYGFQNGEQRWISVRLDASENTMMAKVTDTGKAYDPLSAPEVDTTLSLEDKPIGGLGIHLMKQMMDELSYAREGSFNVLSMRKRFEHQAEVERGLKKRAG